MSKPEKQSLYSNSSLNKPHFFKTDACGNLIVTPVNEPEKAIVIEKKDLKNK